MTQNAGQQLTSEQLQQRQRHPNPTVPGPVVVAVGIHTPENIGGIFRIADAVGCRRIIFVDTPNGNPKRIRRVSRHTSDKIPHDFVSFAEFVALTDQLPELVALEITTTSTNIYTALLPKEMTLVIGGERHGIPEPVLKLCAAAVHLPMFGLNSSMNVATALGIALYEWSRRFRATPGD
jgi:23S rRNA (guanosine2251-2'-O)-methyltransferase